MYFCLTYISKAKKLMSDQDLLYILDESIRWNGDHGVTGMLLYMRSELLNHKEGRFVQALEGKEVDVREIFRKIKADERHFNVTKLGETTLITRNFESWQMGFKSIEANDYLRLPGRFELNEKFLKHNPADFFNPALNLLKQFYNLNLNHDDNLISND
jgi:hypothetical protein